MQGEQSRAGIFRSRLATMHKLACAITANLFETGDKQSI